MQPFARITTDAGMPCRAASISRGGLQRRSVAQPRHQQLDKALARISQAGVADRQRHLLGDVRRQVIVAGGIARSSGHLTGTGWAPGTRYTRSGYERGGR